MKILFVTPGYPPMLGGSERMTQSLAQQLCAMGHEVYVATGTTKTESDFWQGNATRSTTDEAGISVFRFPITATVGGRNRLFLTRKWMVVLSSVSKNNIVRLKKLAKQIPPVEFPEAAPIIPDIIHSVNISWEYGIVVADEWAKQMGVPHVITPCAHFGEDLKGRVAQNSMMQHQRALLESADSILTLTDRENIGFQAWDVAPKNTVVSGCGFDPVPENNDPQETLAKYDLNTPYFIFVGRANFDKGAIHSAKAAVKAKKLLVMIGSRTPEFDTFYEHLRDTEQKYIRHLGKLDENEKHALIASSEALLLPSRSESFGIVLLEAWSHKKPVIGADAGGIPGLVKNEHNGFLVPFGDIQAIAAAMIALNENPQMKHAMGQNGYDMLPNYTWERVAKRVESVYQSLI